MVRVDQVLARALQPAAPRVLRCPAAQPALPLPFFAHPGLGTSGRPEAGTFP